jgi:hypothetical protein
MGAIFSLLLILTRLDDGKQMGKDRIGDKKEGVENLFKKKYCKTTIRKKQ